MIQARTNQAKWDAARKRWRIDVQRNGVRRSFYSSMPGRNGKAECHRKADIWIDEGTIGGDTRCSVLLDRYLENYKGRVGSARLRSVTSHIEAHIRPHIGNIRVDKLTSQHIQDVLDSTSHLSDNTIHNIRAVISNFILYLRKNKFTLLTLDGITSPRGAETAERMPLQPDDLRTLFSRDHTIYNRKVIQDWYIHVYRFLAATGLRPGELIALTHDSVRERAIKITGSINIAGETTRGKNANARRDIRLSDLASHVLDDQYAMLNAAGVTSPYIFCDQDGAAILERALLLRWRKYCRHNNIQPYTLYELRHTYISVNKDMPEALLKLQVGHTPDMDTYGVYSHKIEGDLERAAAHSDAAFAMILDRTLDRT